MEEVRDGAEFTPVGESLCYSATGFHLAHDYTIDLVDALNPQGLEVEHYHSEAIRHGLWASLAPKPLPDGVLSA